MSIEAVPTVRPRSRSLNDVRTVIPDVCYRRSTARATVALLEASLLYLLPVAALDAGTAADTERHRDPVVNFPAAYFIARSDDGTGQFMSRYMR